MSVVEELKICYVDKKDTPKNVIARYVDKLNNEKEQGLFKAATRLFGAYCAAPAFDKTKQLDMLAENDVDMQVLRTLMRNYGKGVVEILDTYDEYFALQSQSDFWEFFNQRLDLPENWCEELKKK